MFAVKGFSLCLISTSISDVRLLVAEIGTFFQIHAVWFIRNTFIRNIVNIPGNLRNTF